MNDFYVYALLDPRKPGYYRYGHWVFHYEPFYVGKGKGNRFTKHERLAVSGSTRNVHKVNKIRRILKSGERLIIRMLRRNMSEAEAFETEIRLIRLIGRGKLGPLVNKTSGGEGISGYKHTEATRLKISQAIARRSYTDRVAASERSRNWCLQNTDIISHFGERNGKSKFSDEQVLYIRKAVSTGTMSVSDIVSTFGVTNKTAKDLISGNTYSHLQTYRQSMPNPVGRPSSLTYDKIKHASKLLKSGMSLRCVARSLGVTYRSVRQHFS